MKKIVVLSMLFFFAAVAFAQQRGDSLTYESQRIKINAMLARRTQKFGEYDESLSKHSGIFGFQTKRDIRRSSDILMDIVKADDDIYKELKILLDFGAFQQTQVQSTIKETENSAIGYMTAIDKLRNQVDRLKTESDKQQLAKEKTKRWFIILLIVAAVVILGLVLRDRARYL